MRRVAAREFEDSAEDLLRSRELLLVEHEGRVLGWMLPLDHDDLDVRRAIIEQMPMPMAQVALRAGMTPAELTAMLLGEAE